jgi:hypothetical protein
MIQIENTIISRELFEKKFVCDLSACKGACCVEGDAGAPLEKEELEILEDNYSVVKEFLRPEGIKAIEEQGPYVNDHYDIHAQTTPLVNGKECAYTVFDEKGIALCGIELAHKAGKIDFVKPISCHLYPVRINKTPDFDAVNVHTWHICKAACECGDKLDVKLYKFLKTALIRKYGNDWYAQVEEADKLLEEMNKK